MCGDVYADASADASLDASADSSSDASADVLCRISFSNFCIRIMLYYTAAGQ